MKPDAAAQEGSTHWDTIMITVCISEVELPNILMVIKRVCVYMHIYVQRLVCLHVRWCVFKGVAFTIAAVLVVCTAPLCFLPLPVWKCVSMGTELMGEKFIRVSQHPARGSDVVHRSPRRNGIGVRWCVSCSLQGSCLHADSHLFAMQKQRRDQRSVDVLQSGRRCRKVRERQIGREWNKCEGRVKVKIKLRLSLLHAWLCGVWKSRWFPNMWWGQGLECTTKYSEAYSHNNFRQLLGTQRAAVRFGALY